jgi:hypothetical protein
MVRALERLQCRVVETFWPALLADPWRSCVLAGVVVHIGQVCFGSFKLEFVRTGGWEWFWCGLWGGLCSFVRERDFGRERGRGGGVSSLVLGRDDGDLLRWTVGLARFCTAGFETVLTTTVVFCGV